MKRRRNDTAKNEPGNRGRVKGRGSERILAKGANTEGAHGTHGLHGRAEAEAYNRPAVGSTTGGGAKNSVGAGWAHRAAKLFVNSITLPSRKVTEPRKIVGVELA